MEGTVAIRSSSDILKGVMYTMYSAGLTHLVAVDLTIESWPELPCDQQEGAVAELLTRVNRVRSASAAFIATKCIYHRPTWMQDVVAAFLTQLASRFEVVGHFSYVHHRYVVARSTVARFPVGHRIASRELEYGGVIERSSDFAASPACPQAALA